MQKWLCYGCHALHVGNFEASHRCFLAVGQGEEPPDAVVVFIPQAALGARATERRAVAPKSLASMCPKLIAKVFNLFLVGGASPLQRGFVCVRPIVGRVLDVDASIANYLYGGRFVRRRRPVQAGVPVIDMARLRGDGRAARVALRRPVPLLPQLCAVSLRRELSARRVMLCRGIEQVCPHLLMPHLPVLAGALLLPEIATIGRAASILWALRHHRVARHAERLRAVADSEEALLLPRHRKWQRRKTFVHRVERLAQGTTLPARICEAVGLQPAIHLHLERTRVAIELLGWLRWRLRALPMNNIPNAQLRLCTVRLSSLFEEFPPFVAIATPRAIGNAWFMGRPV